MVETAVVDEVELEETEFETAFDEIAAERDKPVEATDEEDPVLDPDEEDPDAIAAAAAAEEVKPDPYEGMSEDAKARHVALVEENAKLNHRISSDSGRVRGFQQKADTLAQELATIKKGAPEDHPTENQIKDAMKGSGEEWDQFAEDYPVVAKAIDNRLEAAGEATGKVIDNKLDTTLAPLKEREVREQENEASAAATAAHDVVAEVYPTWAVEVAKPEFTEWLSRQPPGIAALSGSDDTADASTLIGMYDDYLVANEKPSIKTIPTEPGDDKDKDIVDGSESNELATRREQQLKAGSSVPSKSARVDGNAEPADEYEAAFEVYAKRNDAKRTA